jgi:hypothetical protein
LGISRERVTVLGPTLGELMLQLPRNAGLSASDGEITKTASFGSARHRGSSLLDRQHQLLSRVATVELLWQRRVLVVAACDLSPTWQAIPMCKSVAAPSSNPSTIAVK